MIAEEMLPMPLNSNASERTEKIFFEGTHRARTPEATLNSLTPLLGDFGITRVANVTGLDVVGIPVFMAVRPNSRSLSVSQGKGLTSVSAKVSAIMESIENYHAEYSLCPTLIETYSEMRKRFEVAAPETLTRRRGKPFNELAPIPWVKGSDLVSSDEVWVPFELVHANATLPPVPGSGYFAAGTNGLASGNVFSEAVLHALCELIERDALTIWKRSGLAHWDRTALALHTIDDADCLSLLECFNRAGCSVLAWDITSDTMIPTFYAVVFDSDATGLRPLPAAFGSGCHPNRNVALARAFTEAAQSRLTVIAGSRDDLTRDRYINFQSTDAIGFHSHMLTRKIARHVSFQESPCLSTSTFLQDLDNIAGQLHRLGLDRIIVVNLSSPAQPFSVVRVIVPYLEGPSESPLFEPGIRLKEKVHERFHLSRTNT